MSRVFTALNLLPSMAIRALPRGGCPLDRMSQSLSGPPSLNRWTQSRSVWRSMPPNGVSHKRAGRRHATPAGAASAQALENGDRDRIDGDRPAPPGMAEIDAGIDQLPVAEIAQLVPFEPAVQHLAEPN